MYLYKYILHFRFGGLTPFFCPPPSHMNDLTCGRPLCLRPRPAQVLVCAGPQGPAVLADFPQPAAMESRTLCVPLCHSAQLPDSWLLRLTPPSPIARPQARAVSPEESDLVPSPGAPEPAAAPPAGVPGRHGLSAGWTACSLPTNNNNLPVPIAVGIQYRIIQAQSIVTRHFYHQRGDHR